jgi:hypothetical protein
MHVKEVLGYTRQVPLSPIAFTRHNKTGSHCLGFTRDLDSLTCSIPSTYSLLSYCRKSIWVLNNRRNRQRTCTHNHPLWWCPIPQCRSCLRRNQHQALMSTRPTNMTTHLLLLCRDRILFQVVRFLPVMRFHGQLQMFQYSGAERARYLSGTLAPSTAVIPQVIMRATPDEVTSPMFCVLLILPLSAFTASSLSAPKHSRLPPKHVARKVPQKSITSTVQPARPSLKLLQEQSGLNAIQHRIPASSTVLPVPRDLESSDDDDIPLAIKRPRTVTKAGVRQQGILQSIESGNVGTALQQRPRASKLPIKSGDVTAVAEMVCDPRPWNYYVPPELDGVRQALDENDWNEYVSLVQKVLVQEIARDKLDAFTQRTFQVSNVKVYRKIESMVAEMIVGSALELCSVGSGDEGDE